MQPCNLKGLAALETVIEYVHKVSEKTHSLCWTILEQLVKAMKARYSACESDIGYHLHGKCQLMVKLH